MDVRGLLGSRSARIVSLAEAIAAEKHLACRVNPDAWVPDEYVTAWIKEPVRLCGECPLRQQCLELGELYQDSEGIYGGTTPDERRARRLRGLRPGELEVTSGSEAA